MDGGINELFEGPTVTHGSNKYVLPPSSFAEAEIGLMRPEDVKTGLEAVLEHVSDDQTLEAPAIRRAIKQRKANFETLVDRVRKHHEGQSKLITQNAVKQGKLTGGGVWSYEINRRGDARRERPRKVKVDLDTSGGIIHFTCQCPTYLTNIVKGNYGRIGLSQSQPLAAAGQTYDSSGFPTFNTFIACYHVAVALTHISRTTGSFSLPFEFTNEQMLEALFMDVFGNRKEATIDDYLIRQGTITPETLQKVSEGTLTIEVAKHMKSFDKRTKEIITGIMKARSDYIFSGFATDFRGTPNKTASIVMTKADRRSIHILYDSALSPLPFVMLNIPVFIWRDEGRQPVTAEMAGDPIANCNNYVLRLDERTQQEVVSIIVRPDRQLLTNSEIGLYSKIITERKSAPLI